MLTAFGPGSSTPTQTRPVPANRFLPAGQPRPQVVALRGSELRLQIPIAQDRITAIGYHSVGGGALALEPVGRQANEGIFARIARKLFGGGERGLTYYILGGEEGPSTAALDVGAAPGTDVYSPVDGTIVGITPLTLRGQTYGARIDIQPTSAPALVVRVSCRAVCRHAHQNDFPARSGSTVPLACASPWWREKRRAISEIAVPARAAARPSFTAKWL